MRGMKFAAGLAVTCGLLLASPAAWAKVVTVSAGPPTVTMDVPDTFVATEIDRGIQAKTPDDETFLWVEVCKPGDLDAVVKEHDAYWTKEGVTLGTPARRTDESDGHKIIATDYKGSTWKGEPTVVRYLFIDAGLPSKDLVLLSMWTSPEGDKANDADVTKMVGSLEAK